nr:MAG TPA: hypothetical protein [Caudoviricetes sp.]
MRIIFTLRWHSFFVGAAQITPLSSIAFQFQGAGRLTKTTAPEIFISSLKSISLHIIR